MDSSELVPGTFHFKDVTILINRGLLRSGYDGVSCAFCCSSAPLGVCAAGAWRPAARGGRVLRTR